jgi:acyl carrier protein
MDDTRRRLAGCFATVFPNLKAEEVSAATVTSIEGWDSLASINLVSVIEEEFAVQIPVQDLEHLVSFERIADYLIRRQSART